MSKIKNEFLDEMIQDEIFLNLYSNNFFDDLSFTSKDYIQKKMEWKSREEKENLENVLIKSEKQKEVKRI